MRRPIRVSGSSETKTYGKSAAVRAHEKQQTLPRRSIFGKDIADIPTKIQRRMRFTFVDTMDQVIEVALLPTPLSEEENQQQEHPNQPLTEAHPLHMDERVADTQDSHTRRPSIPVGDESSGYDINEQDSSALIIPPTDHINHDPYPQLHAQNDDSQNG